ncbi:MAG TPA: hypothetical protein VGB77_04865 [Abditibacteriaceae bacterium]|jgi:hypothetical protein
MRKPKETEQGAAPNAHWFATHRPAGRSPFAQVHPENHNWNDASYKALNEQAVMIAEFHAWLVKTRIETEQRLIAAEQLMTETAPFARAGLEAAPTPREVPFVVTHFAHFALDVIERRRELNLLNVYYRQAARDENTESLHIEPGNEAEVMRLWEWFIAERNDE